eukprot:TRINITY_DN14396_c0_g1_i1.p1 TRINITY_DN14396_c0_g1~~TRINITY_DN14396_c0_g1_i1.p1  ORF type:complete len:236 (-),score=17.22 TRINITY_DN14396_c0_g1_i1:356-1063(-)
MPSAKAWCCLGVFMDPGVHLQMRFYVGRSKSELRDCYWTRGISGGQLWAPKGPPPPEVYALKDDEYLVVGIEITRNLGHEHGTPKISPTFDLDNKRLGARPALKPWGEKPPSDSILLNSLPTGKRPDTEVRARTSPGGRSLSRSLPKASSSPELHRHTGQSFARTLGALPRLAASIYSADTPDSSSGNQSWPGSPAGHGLPRMPPRTAPGTLSRSQSSFRSFSETLNSTFKDQGL